MSNITVKNINLQVKLKDENDNYYILMENDKYLHVLKNIYVSFKSGVLNAIMGPSGSGKTTFMRTIYGLCDKNLETSGEILYNGEERKLEEWFNVACFSEQQGYIIENRTVR